MKTTRTLLAGSLLCLAAIAGAKPPFLKVFMATYGIDPNTKIGKARCLNCHQPPAPPNRNQYGAALQKAMVAANSRKMTAEILKSVETKEFSKGVTYLSKIKHDIPPGDPMPTVKKAATPKKNAKPEFLGLSLIAGAGVLYSFGRRRA